VFGQDDRVGTARCGERDAWILALRTPPVQVATHNIGITGEGLPYKFGATVRKGGVSTVTAKLKPGTYEFLCGIGGREGAGMSGTLVVK
jgi:plastocyanin